MARDSKIPRLSKLPQPSRSVLGEKTVNTSTRCFSESAKNVYPSAIPVLRSSKSLKKSASLALLTLRSSYEPQKRPSPSPLLPPNSDIRYFELKKVTRELSARSEELNMLKNTVMLLETSQREAMFETHKAKDKIKELTATNNSVRAELAHLEQLSGSKERELAHRLELECEKARITHEARMRELNEKYERAVNIAATSERDSLRKKCSELQQCIQAVHKEFTRKSEELENLHTRETREMLAGFEKASALTRKELYSIESRITEQKAELAQEEKNVREMTIKESQLSLQLAKKQHENGTIEKEFQNVKKKQLFTQNEVLTAEEAVRRIQTYIESVQQAKERYKSELESEETYRRLLHNRLLDLKGNIRVFCRVRPAMKGEEAVKFGFPDEFEGSREITVAEVKNGSLNSTRSITKFTFDKVFQPKHTNAHIFEEISQLVQSSLDGHNVCIFAYGQTGSGKTHTMTSKEDGMVVRAVSQIFASKKEMELRGWSYHVSGEFLEIYNEQINDLMDRKNGSSKSNKYEIRHDHETKSTAVTNVSRIELESPSMVDTILSEVNSRKSVASTKANATSLRSHSIFRVHIEGHNSSGKSIRGLLNLVDLAGSERVSHSQVSGDRLRETQNINKSLSCLGDVIYALNRGERHVPFRNSKLTYLLQYSLSGGSKTLMFVNISPDKAHLGESMNSMRFGGKVNLTGRK